jgi:hypothetical protein
MLKRFAEPSVNIAEAVAKLCVTSEESSSM